MKARLKSAIRFASPHALTQLLVQLLWLAQ
jgi:hypothetical protein